MVFLVAPCKLYWLQVGDPLRAAPAVEFLQEGPQRPRPTQFWSSSLELIAGTREGGLDNLGWIFMGLNDDFYIYLYGDL